MGLVQFCMFLALKHKEPYNSYGSLNQFRIVFSCQTASVGWTGNWENEQTHWGSSLWHLSELRISFCNHVINRMDYQRLSDLIWWWEIPIKNFKIYASELFFQLLWIHKLITKYMENRIFRRIYGFHFTYQIDIHITLFPHSSFYHFIPFIPSFFIISFPHP